MEDERIEIVSPHVVRRSVVVKNEKRLVGITVCVWFVLICILEWAACLIYQW